MALEHLEVPKDISFMSNPNHSNSEANSNLASLNQYVSIDLTNLDHNIEAVTSCITANTQLWPVIKDDAYGHGAIPLAKHLSPVVHGFCVVRPSEGAKLREAGIKQPILVFEPPNECSISMFSNHHLIASVSHSRHLNLLESGCSYHVNIDTGMRRLGASLEELPFILEVIKKRTDLRGEGVYTHFYLADDPDSPTVAQQLDQFQHLQSHFPAEWLRHTANSGAIFHYSKHLSLLYDAVRPGICLYGYSAGKRAIDSLFPILSWQSRLVHHQPVKTGESVSYGSRWRAPNDGWVGTIPVGYAHGLSRLLSNQMKVRIHDALYEQVGSITMDFTLIWLGENKLPVNTSVYLLDAQRLRANIWAQKTNTIAYEITTNISPTVPRVYVF